MSKNMTKYESYKFAFDRIEEALDKNFPFEAIVLEESIITDRLQSFLEANNCKNNLTFAASIKVVLNLIEENDPHRNLIKALDQWRDNRNKCVHGAVKSKNDRKIPEFHADAILSEARKIATDGYELAKKIRTWEHKTKRCH